MKEEEQFRTVLYLIMLFVLLVVAAPVPASGQEAEPEGRPGAGGGCSDLTGKWVSRDSGVTTTWELWGRRAGEGDPTYRVRRISPGNVRGMLAGLDEEVNALILEYVWTTEADAWMGVFKCRLDKNCQASLRDQCRIELYKNNEWDGTHLDVTIKRQQ